MDFKKIKNQRGFGFWDLVSWAGFAAVGVWLYHQYVLHPEGLSPRPATHSAYEDTKH